MLFHDSKDESAWGLALVGFIVVTMVIILGETTAAVQPKAPYEGDHPDVSSPYLQEHVEQAPKHPDNGPLESKPR